MNCQRCEQRTPGTRFGRGLYSTVPVHLPEATQGAERIARERES